MINKTKLLNYRIEESYFKLNPIKEKEKFTLAPKFTCKLVGGKETFTASLRVELDENITGSSPFDLRAEIKGQFITGEDAGDGKDGQLRQAVTALFPFLRSFVGILTSTSGLPPFILPAIDVENMIAGAKSDNVVYN